MLINLGGTFCYCPDRHLAPLNCVAHATISRKWFQSSAVFARRRISRESRFSMVPVQGWDLSSDRPTSPASTGKQAQKLTQLASSLLLYQSALAGQPAQAFLQLLQQLQNGTCTNQLESYGKLFKSLVTEGFTSWEDYMLNQIVDGAQSHFAKAAANGEPTEHLLRAVAHDLNILQQLCLEDHKLAFWVTNVGHGVSDSWLRAASSLSPLSSPTGDIEPRDTQQSSSSSFSWVGKPPTWLLAPLSQAQRRFLMKDLARQHRWGEAAGMLEAYHTAHGYGLVSAHSILMWTGSTLEARDLLKGSLYSSDLELPPHSALCTALDLMVEELRQPTLALPHHWCIPADPLICWQLLCTLLGRLESAAAEGIGPAFRTVIVPWDQLLTLAELAWVLSQHPRARFLVVVQSGDNLPPNGMPDLAAMLSGYGGFIWPANSTLVAGFSKGVPEAVQPLFRNVLKWGASAV